MFEPTKIWALGCAAALFLGASAADAKRAKLGAPLECDNHPLKERNERLQQALDARLQEAGWGRLIRNKKLGVALVDLTDENTAYYAGVNDDVMMYAASLPKIAVLLTIAEEANNGELKWSDEYDQHLANMIRHSSNADANWAIRRVGLNAIDRTVRSPKYCLYDNVNGGLWLGRPFRHGGPSHRDPLFNLSHGATARQVARFYTMLYSGELVSPTWSHEMLRLMAPPEIDHKFVAGLHAKPGIEFLARKSGTFRGFHSDSALIRHDGRVYVLAAVSEYWRGEALMREIARIASDIIEQGEHRHSAEGT